MNFFKVNINICRVCMKSEQGQGQSDLKADTDLQTKFVFTTRLTLNDNDDMPTIICPKCLVRLKVANDFVHLAHESERNLRAFLAKISSDFQQVTKAIPDTASDEEDDVLALIDDTNESASAQEQEPVKEKNKLSKKSNSKLETEPQQNVIKEEQRQPAEAPVLKLEHINDDEDEDESLAYAVYKEANFVDEGENGATDDSQQTELEMLDEDLQHENEEEEDVQNPAAEVLHGSDGYLKEYEVMLEENEDNSTHYVDMEELHLLKNGENVLQDPDSTIPTEVLEELEQTMTEEEISDSHIESNPIVISQVKQKARKSQSARNPRVPKVAVGSENTRFFCMKCNRDFSTKTNLTRHMATHEGSKPYQCSVCGKGFTQNGSLKQHMFTHTGEKPYVCVHCNRGFTQCKSLVFHMRRHTGEKPFPCEKCGLMFRQKDGLKNHILKHHMGTELDGDVDTSTCVICNKVLANKYSLQVHMKKHVNNHRTTAAHDVENADLLLELIDEDELLNEKDFLSEELALNIDNISSAAHVVDFTATSSAEPSRAKKFQCRKCFKCFAIKKNLLRHLSIHVTASEEFFQCKFCEIAFDTNCALKVHMVREHEKEADINLNEYECVDCQLAFQNSSELSEHISITHDLNCPECPNLCFKSQKFLMEHMMEHIG